ncbi:MAG: hypothetical protein Q7S61_01005 [bacterium]|nr:hypothetical protein [bacterium]
MDQNQEMISHQQPLSVPPVSKRRFFIYFLYSSIALLLIAIVSILVLNKTGLRSLTSSDTHVNQVIAYVKNTTSEVSSLHFYSLNKKTEEKGIVELKQDTKSLIQLGSWSPDGRYLPVLALVNLDKEQKDKRIILYLYDSQLLTYKVIYDSPVDGDNLDWVSIFGFSTYWKDSNAYILHSKSDTNSATQILTYITIDGKMQTEKAPSGFIERNSQMSYSVSNKQTIDSVTVGNTVVKLQTNGSINGVVDGKIALLNVPRGPNIGIDDGGNTANTTDYQMIQKEMDKLEKQGLSEEELQKKVVDLLEPKGETTLKLYDLKGQLIQTINLTESTWYTQSALVEPSQQSLIAHQTSGYFKPEKERFILITPSELNKIKILFERSYERTPNSLTQGISFFLSNDGNWIISMRGSYIDDPKTSTVYLKNIITGEEKVICDTYCFDFKVYYPLHFSIGM